MLQSTALDILKSGHNVFLTGSAGSGKSYTLKKYLQYLEENKVKSSAIAITASTGIAATQIGGLATKKPLTIEVSTYEEVPGAANGTRYSLKIELPKVVFTPFAFEPSGDDILENDLEMTALRPNLATPVATAKVVNELTDASNAA